MDKNLENETTKLNEELLDRHLQIMEAVEGEMEKEYTDTTLSLLTFIFWENVWILLIALWMKLGEPIPGAWMTYGVEFLAIIMMIFVLKFTSLDLRKLGLQTKNLKETLKRALLCSLGVVIFLVIMKLILHPGKPLLNWSLFDPFYIVTSVLQEFLARGFLLSCLLRIIHIRGSKLIIVVISSLMFCSLHLYYGFTFMLGAGILSVILGIVYLKDRNIWGVSIIHYVFGILGVMMEFT